MARTLADAIVDDATEVFLNTDEFAGTYRRFVGGNLSTPLEVVGIWTEKPPSRFARHGDATVRSGVLVVASNTDVLLSDKWLIAESMWSVKTADRVQDGWRFLDLTLEERRQQKPNLVR